MCVCVCVCVCNAINKPVSESLLLLALNKLIIVLGFFLSAKIKKNRM